MANKEFLGDSVYVELEYGMLKLTTSNGESVDNTIYLEPDVLANLIRYVAQTKGEEKKAD